MRPGGGAIRVLNVAEKPSVAKSVAEILSRPSGGMRSRDNRVFEFEYTIGGRACHMLVTSVTGHLMELEFDDRFRRWHSCDPADLFQAPVRKSVPQDKQYIKRTLEEEARKYQWLVLWLDCDREGENITEIHEGMKLCNILADPTSSLLMLWTQDRYFTVDGCDDILKELTEISRFGSHNQNATPVMVKLVSDALNNFDNVNQDLYLDLKTCAVVMMREGKALAQA
ncbi:hypothetical protein ABZP36_017996 [Zizania latifolia]